MGDDEREVMMMLYIFWGFLFSFFLLLLFNIYIVQNELEGKSWPRYCQQWLIQACHQGFQKAVNRLPYQLLSKKNEGNTHSADGHRNSSHATG